MANKIFLEISKIFSKSKKLIPFQLVAINNGLILKTLKKILIFLMIKMFLKLKLLNKQKKVNLMKIRKLNLKDKCLLKKTQTKMKNKRKWYYKYWKKTWKLMMNQHKSLVKKLNLSKKSSKNCIKKLKWT